MGQQIPRCGALLPNGGKCRESPVLHPRYHPDLFDRYHPSGRCARHGGASTGPRTPEGKARVAATLREAHAAAARAAGMRRPPTELSATVAKFLELVTWKAAIYATGLSRRQLERLGDGRFCSPEEIAEMTDALRDTDKLAERIMRARRGET
jgi:hypothetical protein